MSNHLIEKNEDWQQVRDEWIGAVEKLVEDAENWSKRGFPTLNTRVFRGGVPLSVTS
jgi:hypothetical protein